MLVAYLKVKTKLSVNLALLNYCLFSAIDSFVCLFGGGLQKYSSLYCILHVVLYCIVYCIVCIILNVSVTYQMYIWLSAWLFSQLKLHAICRSLTILPSSLQLIVTWGIFQILQNLFSLIIVLSCITLYLYCIVLNCIVLYCMCCVILCFILHCVYCIEWECN